MAEGAGLLNQYTGNCIEGSNPFPSAISKAPSGAFVLWGRRDKAASGHYPNPTKHNSGPASPSDPAG